MQGQPNQAPSEPMTAPDLAAEQTFLVLDDYHPTKKNVSFRTAFSVQRLCPDVSEVGVTKERLDSFWCFLEPAQGIPGDGP